MEAFWVEQGDRGIESIFRSEKGDLAGADLTDDGSSAQSFVVQDIFDVLQRDDAGHNAGLVDHREIEAVTCLAEGLDQLVDIGILTDQIDIFVHDPANFDGTHDGCFAALADVDALPAKIDRVDGVVIEAG